MKIIRPTKIDDSNLTSTNVLENEYPVWVDTDNFSVGDKRIYNHRIYECLLAGISATLPPNEESKWLDTGPTNAHAMFDEVVNTATVENSGTITIVTTPGRMNAVAFQELDATDIEVEYRVDGNLVYESAANLVLRNNTGTWFGYFTEPVYQQDFYVEDNIVDVALLDVPAYLSGELTIRIINSEGPVKCGVCVIGLSLELGDTLNDPELKLRNFSQRKFDEFGKVQQTNRHAAKDMSAKVEIATDRLDHIFYWLAKLKDSPLIWLGVSSHGAFIVYGYGTWRIRRRGAIVSLLSVDVEGLV